MVSFRKTFKPTFEEELKNYLYLYHLSLKAYENKECSTCKHCFYNEELHIGGIIDHREECMLNENNVNKDCKEYIVDEKHKNDIFNIIKEFVLESK